MMTDSKTATDRLREMLDARGVGWWEDAYACEHRTVFDGASDVRYCIYQLGDCLFISSILPVTPEQAIAATLGSGECEMRESYEYVECKVQTFTCSACGWYGAIDDLFASDTIPNFCPNCGKAVKR